MKPRTIILVVLFGLALGVLVCGPLVELVSRVADVAGMEEGEVMDEPLVEQPAESEDLPAFEPDDRRQTVLVQTIEAGQTVEATFEGAWDAHNWVFEGRAGQSVTFTTGLPEGAGTDPILTLQQAQDTSGTGVKSLTFTEIFRKQADDVQTVGPFTKTIWRYPERISSRVIARAASRLEKPTAMSIG